MTSKANHSVFYEIIAIGVMTAAFAVAAGAQEAAVERDPFHPADDKLAAEAKPAPATAPSSTDDSWGRDPFSNPLAGTAPAKKEQAAGGPAKVLTGILYGKDSRLAIIGGELYGEGSMVDDRRIAVIRSRSVVFEDAAGAREEVFLENFSVGK